MSSSPVEMRFDEAGIHFGGAEAWIAQQRREETGIVAHRCRQHAVAGIGQPRERVAAGGAWTISLAIIGS